MTHKKQKIIFIISFIIIILIISYGFAVKSMNAFYYQEFSEEDFVLIKKELKNSYESYLDSLDKENSVLVTFNFYNVVPPKNATLELYSQKLSKYIYIGPYKSTLSFFVNENIFDNSIDSFSISIIDSDNRSSYTIEQEKAFEVWEEGKVVNIWFLPFRQYDEETGRGMGYTISLS